MIAINRNQKKAKTTRKSSYGDHLYIIQSDTTGAVKIGRSTHPEKRLKELQTGSPYALRILKVFTDKGDIEHSLHQDVERYRLRSGASGIKGEWFHHDCLHYLPDWLYNELPLEDRWWKKE